MEVLLERPYEGKAIVAGRPHSLEFHDLGSIVGRTDIKEDTRLLDLSPLEEEEIENAIAQFNKRNGKAYTVRTVKRRVTDKDLLKNPLYLSILLNQYPEDPLTEFDLLGMSAEMLLACHWLKLERGKRKQPKSMAELLECRKERIAEKNHGSP